MLALDAAVIHLINPYAQVSHAFDAVVVAMSHNGLVKAGPLLALIGYYWFREDGQTHERRVRIVSLLAASLIAAAIAVMLSRVLPGRMRPMVDPHLGFVIPYSMVPEGWERASSLPSDHAAMFIALSAGMLTISRRWGTAAVIFAVLFVLLPRAYLGLHYPSDLMAGSLIGLACVAVANTAAVRRGFSRHVVDLAAARPQLFYPLLFLLGYQIANVFFQTLEITSVLHRLIAGTL